MDWTTLAVAGMSLVGTLSGTFGGILVSSKLTTYRRPLRERVDLSGVRGAPFKRHQCGPEYPERRSAPVGVGYTW